MKRLIVQVSITENDFPLYKETLLASLKKILNLVEVDVRVFVVYQYTNIAKPDEVLFADTRVTLFSTMNFGVSLARNTGLKYARENDADYIVFHDASILFSSNYIKFINLVIAENISVAKGPLYWGGEKNSKDNAAIILTKKKINPIFDTCVCSYIFKLSALNQLAFNELVGPGEKTLMSAGEDVVFLYRLFGGRIPIALDYCDDATVYHPPRPSDNSKHLAYAESQGTLVRWMVCENKLNFAVATYFFAFFGNAIIRFILRKPAADEMLARRWRGFLDTARMRKRLNSTDDMP